MLENRITRFCYEKSELDFLQELCIRKIRKKYSNSGAFKTAAAAALTPLVPAWDVTLTPNVKLQH